MLKEYLWTNLFKPDTCKALQYFPNQVLKKIYPSFILNIGRNKTELINF